jgi:RNA recognition motif-containing protein
VVEQIPEENFSEDAVREFFSQFGNIVDVNMQAYKRLAIVKYDDYSAARRAYDSPKVIFDNRFVKVYWYKPDSLPKPPTRANGNGHDFSEEPLERQDEDMLDPEEIEKRQAEAQKAYEERQKKAQEADARFQELEAKLKENQEQMRSLQEKLANKSKKPGETGNLIDQLASLQSEAQGLNADYDAFSYRGRGRGGYRARGTFPPRARGFAPFRGAYRGRGYAASPFPTGRPSVKRLDNRPKRISVSGIEPGSRQDEALREHLLVGLHLPCVNYDC